MDANNFPTAPQMTIVEAVQRAYAHWGAGQAHQAEQLCLRVLQVAPDHPDVLNLMGVIAHAYGKLDMAVDFLRRGCKHPETPAPYLSNYAEMCRQKGLLTEAEQAAQRAVQRDPGLVAAWSNLGIILQEAGKLDTSLSCLEKVATLEPDNAMAQNNLANTCKRLGLLDRAQAAYQRALELDPGYAEAYSNLAFLLADQGRFDEAATAARTAIDINPQLTDAYLNMAEIETSRSRNDAALQWLNALQGFAPNHPGRLSAMAQILHKLGRDDEALTAAREAVAASPDHAQAHHVLGSRLQEMGHHQEALAAFERAANLPGTVREDALLSIATAHMENGDKDTAIAAFERVLEAFPESSKVLAARVDTRKFSAGDPDIAVMEAALTVTPPPVINQQMSLHFALGKAYLDTGESALAFSHLDRGNAIKRATFSYDGVATAGWMQRIADAFTPALMQRLSGAGAPSEVPVLVIGMPRSGTTLVEQILASHPDVHGAGELPALRHAVHRAGPFPESVARLDAAALKRIGDDYLAQVLPLAPQAKRIVDKMPANFLHAGLIPLALSGARIIHCRRDPVDTCLSCYSKLFGGEQMFTYQLAELGQFHRAYQALMEKLRQVLPADRFIEVDYEAVVDDLEGQARRLIDFVGLPWDDACLSFHETRRVVRTASVAQVRQPIYTSSKGRWRKHAAHLGPLLAALGVEAP